MKGLQKLIDVRWCVLLSAPERTRNVLCPRDESPSVLTFMSDSAHGHFPILTIFPYFIARMSPSTDVSSAPQNINGSTAEEKTACFQLIREGVSLFIIKYSDDKDDLYRSFMKKLDELNIPKRSMYHINHRGEHYEIDDADALFRHAKKNYVMMVYVRAKGKSEDSSSDRIELGQESLERKRLTMDQKWISKSRSHKKNNFCDPYYSCRYQCHFPGFSYGHSPYSHSCYERFPHAYHNHPTPFCPFMPFYHCPYPRLQRCPFFGMRCVLSGHPSNDWPDGYYS
ncbi:unnamed protein product [Angiostrongylus costaricensis]|uniref:PB1 domain-containing protein n=1 Tax=Angiostrongylus costaricensis TaxID=334426 RepID=A0A0R3PTK9_ANGCS|nr:unnamed protein product [Angiostrongylus costaricensis]